MPEDESGSAGSFLVGAVVLILGGVALILAGRVAVADVGGGMLILVGAALFAASIWLYSQASPDTQDASVTPEGERGLRG